MYVSMTSRVFIAMVRMRPGAIETVGMLRDGQFGTVVLEDHRQTDTHKRGGLYSFVTLPTHQSG